MKKGDWLKVLERHKMLTLAKERRITQRQAAQELVLSLSHTKRLLRRLREAGGDPRCLDYQRRHPAPNRVPEALRDQVTALKRQNRERSNALIADLLREQAGAVLHPSTVRRMLIEKGEYTRSYFRRPCRRFEREAFGELVLPMQEGWIPPPGPGWRATGGSTWCYSWMTTPVPSWLAASLTPIPPTTTCWC